MDFPRPYVNFYESNGVDWDIKIKPKPLHTLVFESAGKFPDKTALIFYGNKVTYAQLAGCIVRAASVLHELGLRKGDRSPCCFPTARIL